MIAPYIFVCAAARLIPLASWQGMAGRRVQQAQPACAVVIMANGEWIGAMDLGHPVALGNPWPKVAFDHSVRRCSIAPFFSQLHHEAGRRGWPTGWPRARAIPLMAMIQKNVGLAKRNPTNHSYASIHVTFGRRRYACLPYGPSISVIFWCRSNKQSTKFDKITDDGDDDYAASARNSSRTILRTVAWFRVLSLPFNCAIRASLMSV